VKSVQVVVRAAPSVCTHVRCKVAAPRLSCSHVQGEVLGNTRALGGKHKQRERPW
jgi:hypothetical protein